MSDPETSKPSDTVTSSTQPSPQNSTNNKSWVKFDEEQGNDNNREPDTPAVINTESVQVNIERSLSRSAEGNNVPVADPKPFRNVELSVTNVEPVRQGFSNGDIIVTLLPVNTKLPWITPAQFRPELVPEELMAQGLTLTVEEYVQALELLVNDVRFSLYNVCYKRVLVLWITIAFIVLLGLLFSGLQGLALFGLGIGWLILNALAIFLSMYLKYKLQRNLEKCLANVNKQLLRHKIVLALDDRGKISCHKVTICFIYLDSAPCIANLQSSIDQIERDHTGGWEQRMDISAQDIIIQGSRTTRLSRKQERATLLYLRYIARWGSHRARGVLNTPPSTGGRHCSLVMCPCQYIQEHLFCKPPDHYPCRFCIYPADRSDRSDPYLMQGPIFT
ncbi:transmembrane protein 268 isoform X1 [Diorhabda sublineata]|uniref:transmembrane protein 268 isoform X1 n=1 Tax=Diorhabda sublineata TaxID=1163346 RepID=UPI0024E171CD|nr:transmembrane protein 268 isoform X1 [Diorhabda sublineata]